MPELPDVEIARRNLERWMAGATILAARCIDRRLVRPGSPRTLARTLVGKTIESVERKGKWLRLVLNDGGRLFSHLGMTGDWVNAAIEAPRQRFERARFDVTLRGRGSSVRYLDMRRFGRLIAASNDIPEWGELGPDPLADGIDPDALARALSRSRRSVKEVLMDQTVLAGIGNILAMESLWMARIDPRSASRALRPPDVRATALGLRRAIARELAGRGHGFLVYGRAGEPCPRCGAPLASVILGGRTSVYCARCQVRR